MKVTRVSSFNIGVLDVLNTFVGNMCSTNEQLLLFIPISDGMKSRFHHISRGS